ncbi:hypothetical protein CPJCM30710_27760 [Clostridium polyendosporum]|uniref:Uncharacterized protein n=1 Tax=Clostridium polyendosporum TaxID=69208 RepID=A0A919S0Q8_9CLOT|nr:hypothetical protein CPJCM30710_27760 [Clostridium polyendosporum]
MVEYLSSRPLKLSWVILVPSNEQNSGISFDHSLGRTLINFSIAFIVGGNSGKVLDVLVFAILAGIVVTLYFKSKSFGNKDRASDGLAPVSSIKRINV